MMIFSINFDSILNILFCVSKANVDTNLYNGQDLRILVSDWLAGVH